MKSRFGAIGNINLRGKKSATLSCGCCDIYNFTDRERERQARQDIDEATTDRSHRRELHDVREFFGDKWMDELVDWRILELQYEYDKSKREGGVW